MVEKRTFNPGDIVFREGDESDGVYIVAHGRLRVFHEAGENEIDIAMIENGDMFGEMGVIERKPRSASVRAVEPTAVDFVPAEQFNRSFKIDDPIALPLLRVLCARIRNQDLIIKGLKRPMVRRRAMQAGVAVKLRGGNLLTEDALKRRSLTLAFFPWVIGRSLGETEIAKDGVRLADPTVEFEHALIEMRDGKPYVRIGCPRAVAVVNDELLRWGTREATPLQVGHNVMILGPRDAKLRFIIEVR